MSAFAELRESLIDQVIEALAAHQVPDGATRCRCGKPIHSGEPGSMTLSRHRAEVIVNEIMVANAYEVSMANACIISEMMLDKDVPSGP